MELHKRRRILLQFRGRLAEVRKYLFTMQGSTFYFVPKDAEELIRLARWQPGTTMHVTAYKMNANSRFMRVLRVKMRSSIPDRSIILENRFLLVTRDDSEEG